MELEVYVYRHKERKDIFIHVYEINGWDGDCFCDVVCDIDEAEVFCGNDRQKCFETWKDKNPEKQFKLRETKEYKRDGWNGKLTKTTELYLKDFEKVTLKEV